MSAHAVAEAPAPRKAPLPLNGVEHASPVRHDRRCRNQPQLAAFRFCANGEWLGGTHMQTKMSDFSGAGGEHSHKTAYTAVADHPTVLCGEDKARRRSNMCCMRWPPASRPASRTSLRRAE